MELGKRMIQKDDLANLSKLLLFCHPNPLKELILSGQNPLIWPLHIPIIRALVGTGATGTVAPELFEEHIRHKKYFVTFQKLY